MPPFRYQAFYCEENVWQLALHPALAGRRLDVVFVSNATRQVAMWHQRAAPPSAPIVWDYHVFVIAHEPEEVWDLDTDLGAPIAASQYLEESFRDDVEPRYAPRFRVVEASTFVREFASDRSHMRDADGAFVEPPPPWPPIGAPGVASNLMNFVAMSETFVGDLKDLGEMRAAFAMTDPRRHGF